MANGYILINSGFQVPTFSELFWFWGIKLFCDILQKKYLYGYIWKVIPSGPFGYCLNNNRI